jgi:uncharacterized Fe-S cluster-containing radical SAM superfamily protein
MNDVPSVPFRGLDTAWFQIAGTICNLRCKHCFISCAPDNRKFGFISARDFTRHLQDAVRLGAREFYFTGGEPFAHPNIYQMLGQALDTGDTTVLTNGLLFRDTGASELAGISRDSGRTLEIRLSIDGPDAETNDAIRGAGVLDQAMHGLRQLLQAGIRPIVTMSRSWDGPDCSHVAALGELLIAHGYDEPRIKILPMLHLGAEVRRSRPYLDCERITPCMLQNFDWSELLCSSSRLVTDRGVWVCPILLDSAEARMGDALADTLEPYPLRHQACYTCVRNGAICSNTSGLADQPARQACSSGEPRP